MSLGSPSASSTQSSFEANDDSDDAVISISTSFHPNTQPAPDTTFPASDGVLFYAFSKNHIICLPTAFVSIIGESLSHPKFRNGTIPFDIPSAELNIIFHALCGTSPASNCPDFETLVRAVDRMPAYSLSPHTLIHPFGSLYELLLFHAPCTPLTHTV